MINTLSAEERQTRVDDLLNTLQAKTWHDLETSGKFDKNAKLSFISDDMLIVGCDIGSETHYLRAIDRKGRELSRKPFSFLNNEEGFDAIVSNPPYFVNSLTCPDDQRTMARHSVSLTYDGLMESAFRLLKPEGVFSLVIPSESRSLLEAAAHLRGFFLSRVCMIRTTPKKQPKRQLIEFLKHPVNELCIEDGIIEDSPNVRSAWYQQLTQDFYIR